MSGDDDGELKRKYMRWSGELQDAYLEALDKSGGLHEARPKALLDLLQPRFPFLTLQNVKNHLQKQRTKEAKGGGASGGVRSTPRQPSSLGEAESEDMGREEGDAAGAGDAAGVSSWPQAEATASAPAAAAAATAGAGAAAGAAAMGHGGQWLPDGWQVPLGEVSGVHPNSLIDLARRALALTVHQLGLYRKLLEELELSEQDHTLLVGALREDPSGQTVVLGAQRAPSAMGLPLGAAQHSTGTASGSGASSVHDEARPLRLRRLLARLLPPNPFSSGPKAEAALKLAAWIAAVTKEPTTRDNGGCSLSAGSHLGGMGDVPAGMGAAQQPAQHGASSAPTGVVSGVGAAPSLRGATGTLSGGGGVMSAGQVQYQQQQYQQQHQQPVAVAMLGAARPAVVSDEDDEDGGDEDAMMQAERQPTRQRRKRHKPLSELLAGIPLQEPLPAELQAMQHAVPTASELQQLLGGVAGMGMPMVEVPGHYAGSPPVGGSMFGVPSADMGAAAAAAAAGGNPPSDPLGPALSLLLQQHLQGAPGVGMQPGMGGQQAHGQGMALDDDAVMLRALDAQMSSLLLQSVSNALMRSAHEGDVPMDAAGMLTGGAGAPGHHVPSPFEVAAAAAAAGEMQIPAGFQAAIGGMGEDPLSTGALDISVLRSFLDMLSSSGLSPLTSEGPSLLPDLHNIGGSNPDGGQAQMNAAQVAAAAGQPLSVAALSGSSGSGGSGGRVGVGGAFSAFQPASGGGTGQGGM